MNRREFIKVAGVTTAVTGATIAMNPKEAMALDIGTEHDQFPAEVTKDFKGFNYKNNIFMRGFWDDKPFEDDYINKTFEAKSPPEAVLNYFGRQQGIVKGIRHTTGQEGFSELDMALAAGASSVDKHYGGLSKLGVINASIQTHPIHPVTGETMKEPVFVSGLFSWDNSKVDKKLAAGQKSYQFNNAQEASKYVKNACKLYGADLVGIAPYNENTKRWTYTEWGSPAARPEPFTMPDGSKEYAPFDPIKLVNGECETYGVTTRPSDFMAVAGFEPKSIIVVAFEMDYDAFKSAPSYVADSTIQKGYSQMGETTHKIAEFLRNLGYKALPCGNDTALSVPLAIEAGLGEGSRMGMVVTEKYGPRVRLAKVYTDLELHPDKPITFGVREFCNVCMKCADACPGKAISSEPAKVLKEGMVFDTGVVGKSNITEVDKWFCNGERCFSFWNYNENGCGTCIAVCPYNKIDEWHHDLTKLVTLTPFKPLLRDLDEWFGYGGPVDADERMESKYLRDAVRDFWEK